MHDALLLAQANGMACYHFRTKLTCLFKQAISVVRILSVKQHQIYQSIIFLKYPITEFLTTLVHITNTSLHLQQIKVSELQDQDNIDRIVLSIPLQTDYYNTLLIDYFVATSEMIKQLKDLSRNLSEYSDIHYYTDSSLV